MPDDPLEDEGVLADPADGVELRPGGRRIRRGSGRRRPAAELAKVSRAGGPTSGSSSPIDGEQRPKPVVAFERQQAARGKDAQVPRRVRRPDDRDEILGLGGGRGVGFGQAGGVEALALRRADRGRACRARPDRRLPAARVARPSTVTRTPPALPSVSRNPSRASNSPPGTPADQAREDLGAVGGHFGPRIVGRTRGSSSRRRMTAWARPVPGPRPGSRGAGPGDTATFLKVTGATALGAVVAVGALRRSGRAINPRSEEDPGDADDDRARGRAPSRGRSASAACPSSAAPPSRPLSGARSAR